MGSFSTYSFPEAKSIVVCGDIHGDFNAVIYKLCYQYQMTDTVLIVAGDCGFGFDKPGYYDNVYNRNSSRLSKANNWVVMIRGNHDDPAYFQEERISHERFRCIPDYSVIQACGHSILCVGGHLFAISGSISEEAGFDGYVFGFASNKEVLAHYIEKLGAIHIGILHPYQFAIETDAMKKILETYTFEQTDEEV